MSKAGREVVLEDTEARRTMRRTTRRALLTGGFAAVAGAAAYYGISTAPEDNGTSWPLRRVLDFNGRLWHRYLNDARLQPTYAPSAVRPLKVTGDIGLKTPVGGDWELQLNTGIGPALSLNLDDIRALPKVEMIMRHYCVEGWSSVAHWSGARFSDFVKTYYPPNRPLPQYVHLTTPDEQYYVGLDMKSALHPQTLLAYEKDGQPLTSEHGAPLRLETPIKYGIKCLKRIGAIQFTNQRPADYWAEEGYDWFAGL